MFRIAEFLVKEALCCADGGDSEHLAFFVAYETDLSIILQ